jgi:exosortase E/protease (VPEID-CTERM system)
MVELVALAPPFDTAADLGANWQGHMLFLLQHGFRPAFITGFIAAIFFGWPVLIDELRQTSEQLRTGGSARWLMLHIALIVPLVFGSLAKRPGRLTSVAGGEVWVLGWAALGSGALITLALAALPIRFWKRWLNRSRARISCAIAIGWAAYLFGTTAETLLSSLQRSTFALTVLLLQAVGLAVQADPAQHLIATRGFAVRIAPICSGIEGIGLVTVFLAVYLWLYRDELRFPQVLVLLPAGMFGIWLLNGFRIAALVLIGNWAPEAAVRGFHSVAGWLFFNAMACLLVWTSRRFQWFRMYRSGRAQLNPALG